MVGFIDASEMPDTYGVPFDAVRAFVCGGWADVRNDDGELSSKNPLLRLSLANFEEDIVPTLSSRDTIIILGCGAEPPEEAPAAAPAAADDLAALEAEIDSTPKPRRSRSRSALRRQVPAAAKSTEGLPTARLWAVVPKAHAAGAKVGVLCAATEAQAAEVERAAKRAACNAAAVVSLECAGYGGGGSGLAELSLKLLTNATSTYAIVQRGLVYRNRMINTGPTNAKIYDRCVRLIA